MSNIFKLSLLFTLIFSIASAQQFVDKQAQYVRLKNKIINGGFENGTSNWTASGGSFTVSTTAGDFRSGLRGAIFDASAAAQTLTSSANTVPAGNNQVSCYFKTTATDYTFSAFDGTNLVSTQTIPSSTEFTKMTLSYGMATAGALRIRITSGSNAAALQIDDCVSGEDDSIGTVAQAQFVGSAHFATTSTCTWARTNTALGSFGTVSACPGPTVDLNAGPGTIQTTDTDLPKVTVNNLPPGNYEVIFSFNSFSTGAGNLGFAVNDGTTTDGTVASTPTTSTSSTTTLVAHFNYTTSANRTFEIFSSASTAAAEILNATDKQQTNFSIKRYPSANETAWRPDQPPIFIAAEFTGANPSLGTANVASYTEITDAGLTLTPISGSAPVGVMCSTTNAATAPSTGATTCAAGNESVGINFTIPKAGWYEVCFDASHRVETDSGEVVRSTFQVIETPTSAQTLTQECGPKLESGGTGMTIAGGTTAQTNTPGRYCGQCNFTSVGIHGVRLMYEQNISGTPNESILFADANASNGQRVIRVTAKQLQPFATAPLIMNSVMSNNTGVLRIEAADVTCSSSSSVTSNSSIWVTSGNVSSGACALTFSPVFAAAPWCSLAPIDSATSTIQGFKLSSVTSSSATFTGTVMTSGSNTLAASTTARFHLICIGSR